MWPKTPRHFSHKLLFILRDRLLSDRSIVCKVSTLMPMIFISFAVSCTWEKFWVVRTTYVIVQNKSFNFELFEILNNSVGIGVTNKLSKVLVCFKRRAKRRSFGRSLKIRSPVSQHDKFPSQLKCNKHGMGAKLCSLSRTIPIYNQSIDR